MKMKFSLIRVSLLLLLLSFQVGWLAVVVVAKFFDLSYGRMSEFFVSADNFVSVKRKHWMEYWIKWPWITEWMIWICQKKLTITKTIILNSAGVLGSAKKKIDWPNHHHHHHLWNILWIHFCCCCCCCFGWI